jgi:hypothetical protein
MTIEQGLRMVAGTVVLLSVGLTVWVSPWWLLLTAFVGINLLQSAFTNWCPMVWILARLGLEPCVASSRVAAGDSCGVRGAPRNAP